MTAWLQAGKQIIVKSKGKLKHLKKPKSRAPRSVQSTSKKLKRSIGKTPIKPTSSGRKPKSSMIAARVAKLSPSLMKKRRNMSARYEKQSTKKQPKSAKKRITSVPDLKTVPVKAPLPLIVKSDLNAEPDSLLVDAPNKLRHSSRDYSSSIQNSPSDDDERSFEIGFGDFVFFSVLIGKAFLYGGWVVVALTMCSLFMGLALTLILLLIWWEPLPALPLPVSLGLITMVVSIYLVNPFLYHLNAKLIYI